MSWENFVIKYLLTNQNFHKSINFHSREFNFLEKDIYVNKGTLQIYDIFY